MNKILILGAAGQFGSALVKALSPHHHVTGLTRKDFEAEFESPSSKLAQYKDFDYLINCIAFHKVDLCESDVKLSLKLNAEFVRDLSLFCDANGVTFVHISTDYIFDGRKREAYKEDDLPGPLNVYGVSKLAGEMFIKAYAQKYFIFRVSSLFGESNSTDPSRNFVEKMVLAAKERRPLKVINDQIMAPTYTVDASQAIKHFIDNDITDYGVYHACNSGECSWFEFARTIFEFTGLDNDLTPVTYTEFHTKAKRPQYCSMDNSKLRRYYAMRSWQDGLKDYLKVMGYLKKER